MDQELKQRLIGAAVVTALAAIFIPMLFDDPIDDSGRIVSELTIPQTPVTAAEDTANKLPSGPEQVTGTDTQSPTVETASESTENREQEETIAEETGQPIDEQQWIEESRAEEEPEAVEDTGANIQEAYPKKPELSEKPAPKRVPAAKPATAKIAEEPLRQPVKPRVAENKTAKIPRKTIQAQAETAKISTTPPAATVKKPLAAPKVEVSKANTGFSRWYIQAGSFGKKENALSLWENLRKQGLPVVMETQTTAKGPLYRLKVGPELDKKRAADIRDRLNKQNIKTILVAE
jgi:DedD protein